MKEEFEAEVSDTSYSGWGGWVEEITIFPTEGKDIDERLTPFIGKKVKIIIEEVK